MAAVMLERQTLQSGAVGLLAHNHVAIMASCRRLLVAVVVHGLPSMSGGCHTETAIFP